MQKILEKNKAIDTIPKEKNTLKLKDIENFYQNGGSELKLGLEYERLSLNKETLKNADYEAMAKIIADFSKILNWEVVYDNDVVISAKDNSGNSISLEPGCQLEISLAPAADILDIDLNLSKYAALLDKIADIYDVVFLGYGVSPLSNADDIDLLKKKRYILMNEYLPDCPYGELCPEMMRQTAAIQVNIDYKNNIDAYKKLKFLNMIMPFMSALFSNSPVKDDKFCGFKSKRSQIWLYTGKDRCNMFYKDIFKGFNREKNIFKNYIKAILNVPMIFIERNNEIIPISGRINFSQYLKDGYRGYFATMDDYILHQSLCFPDVRLRKKCIEIRNHDSQDPLSAVALCAFYKGLLNNDTEFLLNRFSYLKIDKIEQYFKNAAECGLDFKINKIKQAWDVIIELYQISLNTLSSKEKTCLNPIFEMLKAKKTKADILIDYGFKTAKDVADFYLK